MNELAKIEQTVLGTIIERFLDSKGALDIVRHHHFEKTEHQHVCRAVENLSSRNEPVDILTVTSEVSKMGLLQSVGGSYFIGSLLNSRTYEPLETYCYLILEGFLKRQMTLLGVTVQSRVGEPICDVYAVMDEIEKTLSELQAGIASKKVETVGEIRETVLTEMETVLTTGRKSGVLCGIEAINKHTSGWQKGNLIIVAGRPGMGKTAVAVDFALTPAMNGEAVAFFSLEMSKEEITGRIMSVQSSIPSQDIVNKSLNRDNLNYLIKNSEQLKKIPLFIDDTPALTLYQLRSKSRKLKRDKDVKLIVVDYLQLMTGSGNKKANREQDIAEISRGLKALAKELQVPIIALSQLNRGPEDRPNKKPMMSDLRESGAIEQDADMVIFPFRPEYYDIERYETSKGEIPTEGLMMFIFAKFRNGSPGEIRARFIKEQTMITNYNY